tara:strand:- start:49372 stop:50478 length:1107 start_codon:yes stop_codon:yes gene_type:complete
MNKSVIILLIVVGILNSDCTKKNSQGITSEEFGVLSNGSNVQLYTLTNSNGMEVKITNFGGIVTSIKTPDKDGNFENVVLGFDNLDKYLEGTPYFGAIIGRYGNRIAKGEFTLDGEHYSLAKNNGNNHLHGGVFGYDKVLWNAKPKGENAIELSYLSKDGEEGYPGNLEITVIYSLTNQDELKIDYKATTDKATPVNLTNHSYFNLSGNPESLVLDHKLQIAASKFTPVNRELIPTGEIVSVEGTPFDFTTSFEIGARLNDVEGGYDHNFVLDRNEEEMPVVATLYDEKTGRKMEILTTEPGLQFYSGNFLDGTIIGSDGAKFLKHSALCLETQHYPDSPNQANFPNTILRPENTYISSTVYRFSVRE